jgi:hypothetical protein
MRSPLTRQRRQEEVGARLATLAYIYIAASRSKKERFSAYLHSISSLSAHSDNEERALLCRSIQSGIFGKLRAGITHWNRRRPKARPAPPLKRADFLAQFCKLYAHAKGRRRSLAQLMHKAKRQKKEY